MGSCGQAEPWVKPTEKNQDLEIMVLPGPWGVQRPLHRGESSWRSPLPKGGDL